MTLNKHRGARKPDDEQLHVLPLYVIDESDEFGDERAQRDKFENGAVEMLSKYVAVRLPAGRLLRMYDAKHFVRFVGFRARSGSGRCR